MAEETIAEGTAGAPAEGSRFKLKFKFKLPFKVSRKVLLIAGPAVLVLLLGAGGYLYWSGSLASLMGHKSAPPPAPPKPLVFFDLPDFLVNLNSTGKKSNFLKLTVSLQIEKPEDQQALQAVLPRIIDSCQIFLRQLRVDDLRGSEGLYRLREELLARINAVSPVKVDDVLFKQMLVQ
jgi:flagellar FliL protein